MKYNKKKNRNNNNVIIYDILVCWFIRAICIIIYMYLYIRTRVMYDDNANEKRKKEKKSGGGGVPRLAKAAATKMLILHIIVVSAGMAVGRIKPGLLYSKRHQFICIRVIIFIFIPGDAFICCCCGCFGSLLFLFFLVRCSVCIYFFSNSYTRHNMYTIHVYSYAYIVSHFISSGVYSVYVCAPSGRV